MRNNLSDEIERIGFDNIATQLKITPKGLKEKIDHPKTFKISELKLLQTEFNFSDKMILELIRN